MKTIIFASYMERWAHRLRVMRIPKSNRFRRSRWNRSAPIDVVHKLWHGTVLINYRRSKFVFIETYEKDKDIAVVRIGTYCTLMPKDQLHWKAAIRRRRSCAQPLHLVKEPKQIINLLA